MKFPVISNTLRLERLQPPTGKVRMVLDTDTYNEIDDQFALVHALLSPERLDVKAVYAAPFHNKRSTGPADGMEKSYEEILRLLDRLDVSPEGFALRGSTGFLSDWDHPHRSEAALDLIERAMAASERPVFISDSGDNVTAGSAGDTSLFAERLVALGARDAVVAGRRGRSAIQREDRRVRVPSK